MTNRKERWKIWKSKLRYWFLETFGKRDTLKDYDGDGNIAYNDGWWFWDKWYDKFPKDKIKTINKESQFKTMYSERDMDLMLKELETGQEW